MWRPWWSSWRSAWAALVVPFKGGEMAIGLCSIEKAQGRTGEVSGLCYVGLLFDRLLHQFIWSIVPPSRVSNGGLHIPRQTHRTTGSIDVNRITAPYNLLASGSTGAQHVSVAQVQWGACCL